MEEKPDKKAKKEDPSYEEPEAPKMDIHKMMSGLKDMLPEDTVKTLLSSCKPREPEPELAELHLIGSEEMILKILGK